MASFLKAKTITLVANTVQTHTMTQQWDVVECLNHSTSDVVYFRGDGTAAVVAADDNEAVLPGERLSVHVVWSNPTSQPTTGTVSVISAGTPNVTIVGA